MREYLLFPLFLSLSCGYGLRGIKVEEKKDSLRLVVINRTSEPELEIMVKKESIKAFERGGFEVMDDAKNSISIYILSYSSIPSPFFSPTRPSYRVSMMVKAVFEKEERKKESRFSQYEEYLKSGIISFDREREEAAKNSIVKLIVDEIYEEFINFLNEKD
mgnify:CR=1 FL=1